MVIFWSLLCFTFGLLYFKTLISNINLNSQVRKLEIDKEYSEIMSAEYTRHIRQLTKHIREVDWEMRTLLQNINPQFSKEELKMMQHYLHPDKHRGKTNDLHSKINGLIDE